MLVIDISINRKVEVEEIGIIRMKGDDSPDSINEYHFGFIIEGKLTEVLGKIQHKYSDDCGLKLATRVMVMLNDLDIDGELAKERRKARESKEFLELYLAVENSKLN